METTAIIALTLLVISEVLPFTPLAGNGIVHEVVKILREVFPYSSRNRR
jgi:hypothetical protein